MNRPEEFKRYLNTLNLFHRAISKMTLKKSAALRTCCANRYLAGQGIELGPEANPLVVTTNKVSIEYVDRLRPEETAKIYAIPLEHIVRPDYFAEADKLSIFGDGRFDFVIANHLLEHMVDPIGAIVEWLRVLKDNGTLFLTVPNYRCNEYDFSRKPVTIRHLIDDYRALHADRKTEHWKEFIELVEGINPGEPAFLERLNLFENIDFRIHMHVFDNQLVVDIFKFLSSIGESIMLLDTFSFKYGFEILFVVKKALGRVENFGLMKKFQNLTLLSKIALEYFVERKI